MQPSWGHTGLKPDVLGPVRTCFLCKWTRSAGHAWVGPGRGGGEEAEGSSAGVHSPRLQDDVLVQGFLSAGQATLQHVLVPLGQLLLRVPLGSPQNERLGHLGKETPRFPLGITSPHTTAVTCTPRGGGWRVHVPCAGG